MSRIDKERALTPIPSGLNLPSGPALLHQAQELLRRGENVVHIPAGETRDQVDLLPKAVFFYIDHGLERQRGVEFNVLSNQPVIERLQPSFYGAYLFGIGKRLRELRFITLPVATFPGNPQYNRAILEEMTEQNCSLAQVETACNFTEAKKRVHKYTLMLLPSLRFITQGGKFLREALHLDDPGWVLTSGWLETGQLTIIGDPGSLRYDGGMWPSQFYPHFDQHTTTSLWGGMQILSNPLVADQMGEFETGLVQKVIEVNS